MPTIQLRDVPQKIYDKLVQSAEANRRSLTQEAIVILEGELLERNKESEYLLRKAESIGKIKKIAEKIAIKNNQDIVNLVRQDRDK